MRNVLIVSHSFPPRMSAGVFRILRFLKYLPRNGWQPSLVTARFWGWALRDHALNDLVPPGIPICRAASPDLFLPFRALRRIGLGELQERLWAATQCPDHHIAWVPPACHAGLRAFRRTRFDLLFSSAPPFSGHLIGLWLKRRTRLPWVADFRDDWSLNPNRTSHPRCTARFNGRLERRVLASATAVTAVSEPMREGLARLAGEGSDSPRFFTVTNAYDPDMFRPRNCAPDPKKFVISYIGSLDALRTGETFCAGLEHALAEGVVDPSRLVLRFVSNRFPPCSPVVASVVAYSGRVPHRKAIRHMLQSHVLLLLISREQGPAMITAKLFEYLGARRTILAVVPGGSDAAEIVRQTRSGVVVEPDDVPGIARAIGELYERWRRGLLSSPLDPQDVARYDGAVVTRQMARVFDWALTRLPKHDPCGGQVSRPRRRRPAFSGRSGQ